MTIRCFTPERYLNRKISFKRIIKPLLANTHRMYIIVTMKFILEVIRV